MKRDLYLNNYMYYKFMISVNVKLRYFDLSQEIVDIFEAKTFMKW